MRDKQNYGELTFGTMARADIFTYKQYANLTHNNTILIFIISTYWHILFSTLTIMDIKYEFS